jgi:hypothetical protein
MIKAKSIEETTRDAAAKAEKKAQAAKEKKDQRLEAAFNTAAQFKSALTALCEANPDFQFVSETTANGAYFVTNVPVKQLSKEAIQFNKEPVKSLVVLVTSPDKLFDKEDGLMSFTFNDKGIYMTIDPIQRSLFSSEMQSVSGYRLSEAKSLAKWTAKLAGKRQLKDAILPAKGSHSVFARCPGRRPPAPRT